MNLWVSDFDVVLHALGFEMSIVSVNDRNFAYVVGAQIQLFSMRGQQGIIDICSYIYAPNIMIFCALKMLSTKINLRVSNFDNIVYVLGSRSSIT